jgi:hypothetical protein
MQGQSRVWSKASKSGDARPLAFLWPWQSKPFYAHEDPAKKLASLEEIWRGSRHYGAVLDALYVIGETKIHCAWVLEVARDAIRQAHHVSRWRAQHLRDLIDVVRAETFEEARYDADDFSERLSRDEACQFTVEYLRATPAATTPEAVRTLLTRMRRRDQVAFGRYYLPAGSVQWREKYFSRRLTPARAELYQRYRRRAAQRGHAISIEGAERDAIALRQHAARRK